MISIVDTHAHLDVDAFDADRKHVLEAALNHGVHAIVLIGYDPERWETTSALCSVFPFLVRAVGVHPNSAGIWSKNVQRRLETELDSSDVVAIGETGLDLFRNHANREEQQQAFREQLRIAQAADLPIIIHQRSAEDAVLAMIADAAPVRGVMHCFSGGPVFARRCIELGLHLGVGGIVTYPKSGEIREALAAAPLDRLLLETDAPYLAPQAKRGRRNEPAEIRATLETLADVRGMSVEALAAATTANAEALFGPRLSTARMAGQERARCRS